MGADKMYCRMCGEQLPADAAICEKCGHVIERGAKNQPNGVGYMKPLKSKGIAAVLSVIFMGLGQIYAGKIARGVVLAIIEAFCISQVFAFSLALLAVDLTITMWAAYLGITIVSIVLWAWQVFDAYKLARDYNDSQKQPVNVLC